MKHSRQHGHWSGGTLIAVASSLGLLVGLRSIVAVPAIDLTALVSRTSLPVESLGIGWSGWAVWPAQLQEAALGRLLGTVVALFLASVTVAMLNAVILLAESASSRRSELALRAAVGATPWTLARMLFAELRTLMVASLALGLLAGLSGGAAARAIWPGSLAAVTSVPLADIAAGLILVLAVILAAYLTAAWETTRSGKAAATLRSGTRSSSDPSAIFTRNALTVTQTAVAGTVLAAALTLAGSVLDDVHPSSTTDRTVVIEATAPTPEAWAAMLATLRQIPSIEAASMGGPGALVGLGIRDVVLTECGNCVQGGFPAPLWNALADTQVVAPGFFEMAGLTLVAGRSFSRADDRTSRPVAVINQTLARSSFEAGAPIGKKVRIGAEFDSWYTVVGIVEDWKMPVLGAEGLPREAVYLSALQRPPASGRVLLRGDEGSVQRAETILAAASFAPTSPVSLTAYRSDAASELRWAHRIAVVLGLLTLLLAAHGAYATALQTTRRRSGEFAIRRSVGAPSYRIVTYVLGSRLRVTGWGVAAFAFFGTLVATLLQEAAGMPWVGPLPYAAIAAILGTASLLASLRATREALSIEPAELLH